MSYEGDEQAIEAAQKNCKLYQSMIVYTSKNLDELRTQCSSTDKITLKEIKDAEVSYFLKSST